VLGVLPSVFSRQEGARDFAALKRTFFFGTRLAIAVSTFFAFGLLAWGKPFIHRWMGSQYEDAYPVLVFLTMGLTFFLWQTASISLLYGTSRHKFLAMFNSLEALVNLGLSLVLVKRYGIVGVAAGTTFPIAINTLLVIPIYVCRVSNVDYLEYIRNAGRTVAVALASLVLPTLLALRFDAPDYKVLAILGVVSTILYVPPMWVFGFSTTEARTLLRVIWPARASGSARTEGNARVVAS